MGRTVIILLSLLLLSSTAQAGPEEDYQKARKALEQIENSPSRQKYRDKWEEVCARFEKVVAKHPKSARADDALFMLGRIYERIYRVSYLKSDLDKAVEYYQRLADEYPKSNLADDALVQAGNICLRRNRKAEAWSAFNRAATEFAKGDMAKEAKAKAADLAAFAPKPAPKDSPQPTPVSSSDASIAVLDLDYISDEDTTKVLIDLSQEADFERHSLPADPGAGKSPRIFVDLLGATLPPDFPAQKAVNDGLVQSLRIAQNEKGRVRVVLDLARLNDSRLYPLQLEDRWRLILEVYGSAPAVAETPPAVIEPLNRKEIEDILGGPAKPDLPNPIEKAPTLPPTDVNLYQALGADRIKRIAIDAGHGGKDPGAIGEGGLKEKDITLAVSKLVSAELKRRGYETYLVRDDDRFVQLDFRVQLAKKAKADLFISIHCNAARNSKAHGIETYYLDPKAKNRAALETAAFENAMSVESISDVEFILLDMSRTARQKESRAFAEVMQESLMSRLGKKHGPIRDLGVKGAPFRVLVGAQMPSILIETAFLTNKADAKRLRSEDYKKALAAAVADGVDRYADSMNLARRGE